MGLDKSVRRQSMKKCKTCIYFPCTKVCCSIENEACNDYESIVKKEIEEVNNI